MSRKLVIEIDLENDAFGTAYSYEERVETERILKEVVAELYSEWNELHDGGCGLRDTNGNTVGRAEVREDR